MRPTFHRGSQKTTFENLTPREPHLTIFASSTSCAIVNMQRIIENKRLKNCSVDTSSLSLHLKRAPRGGGTDMCLFFLLSLFVQLKNALGRRITVNNIDAWRQITYATRIEPFVDSGIYNMACSGESQTVGHINDEGHE